MSSYSQSKIRIAASDGLGKKRENWEQILLISSLRFRALLLAFIWFVVLCTLVAWSAPGDVFAQEREKTLRVLSQEVFNQLDVGKPGYSRATFGLSFNIYDRLISWDRFAVGNDAYHFDANKPAGELAESWKFSDDNTTITFYLRKDATFHDGSAVTAHDVKWSLDRAVSLKHTSVQLKSGAMTDPNQFSVIDDHTFQVKLPGPSRYTLANLGVPLAPILNSKLIKKHVTQDDPWGAEWTSKNDAGGGAYMVESWKPGEQMILKRYDNWKSGPLPYFERVIYQTVSESANRAALMERGRADLCIDLTIKDVLALEKRGKVKIASIPMLNAFEFIAFNSQMQPYDNRKVRQAIAFALPYEEIYKSVYFSRGGPLWGGKSVTPEENKFPQPFPYKHDPAMAKKLLTEAGYPNGFKTTFSFSVTKAQMFEPLSVLVQQALKDVGIEVEIQKYPGAQIATLLAEKQLPMFASNTVAWLSGSPDYWFRIFYSGDWRWNFGNYKSEELAKLLEEAKFETNEKLYDQQTKKMIHLALQDIPILPFRTPAMEVVMASDLEGFTYWFHRELDYRQIKRKK